MSLNFLNLDPSRTKTLRRFFGAKAKLRFNESRRYVTDLVDGWGGTTSKQKLGMVNARLRTAAQSFIQQVNPFTKATWFEDSIHKAYIKGIERAFSDTRQVLGEGEERRLGAQRQFVMDVRQAYQETMDLLVDKAKNDLDNIVDHINATVRRRVNELVRAGASKKKIKAEIKKIYDTAINTRVIPFVAVQIVGAQADGQLDGLERLDVKYVGVKAEWKVRRDERGRIHKTVCPRCRKMDGRLFSIKEARGKIPLHPRCQCAWETADQTIRRRPIRSVGRFGPRTPPRPKKKVVRTVPVRQKFGPRQVRRR